MGGVINNLLQYKYGDLALERFGGVVTPDNLIDMLEYITRLHDLERMAQLYHGLPGQGNVTAKQIAIFERLIDDVPPRDIAEEFGYSQPGKVYQMRKRFREAGII